jgi:hypothetical protein
MVEASPTICLLNARTEPFTASSVSAWRVGDETGHFSFTILFLAPDQGADVLIVEGDLPATARAYLGVRGPDALTDELRRHRDEYRRSPSAEAPTRCRPMARAMDGHA